MLFLKVAPVFLFTLVAAVEKKIELQDIEEDNLKSEKEKDQSEPRTQSSGPAAPDLVPLDFLKSGLLRYFDRPAQAPQQRYVQQYAVTEPPERPPPASPKPHYGPPQQAMVGYLSNIPMQIYIVPQYYSEQTGHEASHSLQSAVQYSASGPSPSPIYHSGQHHTAPAEENYADLPQYVTPTGKSYMYPYQQPFTYVAYVQPTVSPAQTTVAPVVYQMPMVQYQSALMAPPVLSKGTYQTYTENNVLDDEGQEIESPKQYITQTEVPYSNQQEFPPRYYNSRMPIREEYRHSSVSELPPPNPLLLKSPPPHLAHLPKALPMFSRPKPVYGTGANFIPSAYLPKPSESYGSSYKKRPTSLLDSYIPSGVQVEYMKKGYAKDALSAYEALSSGRHYTHTPFVPRQYERGFLPNQMYHTAAGGITYGHYKRTPKEEKVNTK